MKNTFLGLIAIAILTVACKKDEKATYLKDETGTQQPNVAVNNAPQASLLNQAGVQNVQAATPVAATSAPGMNPPHGQPGHRCDIAVGQPLTSAPPAPTGKAQNVAVNAGQTQTIQIDPNSLKPGKFSVDNKGKAVQTAPGMNPPHGQPGHRCDIPVGQPLNSKPAPAPQPAQNIVQNTPAPTPVQQTPPTGEKPKVNPAHGEPWHDCAVKVGDPLP